MVQQCLRGRVSAFEPLVAGHQTEAIALARALLLDHDEADDAVQDAFVRAYRSLGKLAPGSAFGPWFRTILRRICIDRLRAPARRDRESLTDAIEGAAYVEPVGTQRLEREHVSKAIANALRSLSAPHREVLVLKEIEGLGYNDIARALGIAEGTVASRIFHARAALKRELLRVGIDSSEGSA